MSSSASDILKVDMILEGNKPTSSNTNLISLTSCKLDPKIISGCPVITEQGEDKYGKFLRFTIPEGSIYLINQLIITINDYPFTQIPSIQVVNGQPLTNVSIIISLNAGESSSSIFREFSSTLCVSSKNIFDNFYFDTVNVYSDKIQPPNCGYQLTEIITSGELKTIEFQPLEYYRFDNSTTPY